MSVMHVWSRYHQPLIEAAASNNLNKNLTLEANWPFDEAAACAWECQGRTMTGGACADVNVTCSPPNPVQVSYADAKPNAKVVNVTRLKIPDFEGMKAVLAKGQDVWFAMHVNQDQFSENSVNSERSATGRRLPKRCRPCNAVGRVCHSTHWNILFSAQ